MKIINNCECNKYLRPHYVAYKTQVINNYLLQILFDLIECYLILKLQSASTK